MTYRHIFFTVDTHTAGEPTRIVLAGVPFLSGATMAEKRRQLQENHDHVRTTLIHEPRGHSDMFGAVLTAPSNPQAHAGVVFMDGEGYLAMCGHGTIGVVTAILETGLVTRREPETEVILDTPAGLVRARAMIKDGRVQEVAFQNVPAFVTHSNVPLKIPDLGTISADIAFGGNIFALVAVTQLGLAVRLDCIPELIHWGMAIRQAANAQLSVQHPTQPHIHSIDLVEFYEHAPGAENGHRNVVIFGNGQVDRSPCGTGTCARMAVLHATDKLRLGEQFVSESILGTQFRGRLLRKQQVGPTEGVVPEITGSAYVTGFQQFVVDPDDPLATGFVLPHTG